jgi:hypothetical protein
MGNYFAVALDNGVASFSLDNNVYQRAITDPANAYTFTPDSVTITTNPTNITARMIAKPVTTPSDPTMCSVSFYTRRNGVVLTNYALSFSMDRAPTTPNGNTFIGDVRTATSDAVSGLLTIQLDRTSGWSVNDPLRPGYGGYHIDIPDATNYTPPPERIP